MSIKSEHLEKQLVVVRMLPDGTYFDTCRNGSLDLILCSQQQVAAVRAALGPALWRKEYVQEPNWWAYHAEVCGVPVRIYGVHEAPPTCKAIVEEYDAEEQVPVAFETRIVHKQRIVGWDCGPENAAATPAEPAATEV